MRHFTVPRISNRICCCFALIRRKHPQKLSLRGRSISPTGGITWIFFPFYDGCLSIFFYCTLNNVLCGTGANSLMNLKLGRNNLFLSEEAFKGFTDLFLKLFVSRSLHFIFFNFIFSLICAQIYFALILNLYLTMLRSPSISPFIFICFGLVVCFVLQFVMFYTFYCFLRRKIASAFSPGAGICVFALFRSKLWTIKIL